MRPPPSPEVAPADPAPAGEGPLDQDRETGVIDAALWRSIATTDDRVEYLRSWLAILCTVTGCEPAAVLERDGNGLAVVAAVPGSTEIDRLLLELARDSLQQRTALVEGPESDSVAGDTGAARCLLAYPLVLDDERALVIAARLAGGRRLEPVMQQLQLASAWVELYYRRQDARRADGFVDNAAFALDLVARVAAIAERESAGDAAIDLVTRLAARLRCERVVLGVREGRGIRLLALSNSGQFGQRMNVMRQVSEAMLEAFDQGRDIRLPRPLDDGAVDRRHRRLMREVGAEALMTVCIHDGPGAGVALQLDRSLPEPFEDAEHDLAAAIVAAAGPVLTAKRSAERPLPVLAARRFAGFAVDTAAWRHPLRSTALAAVIAAAVIGATVEGDFEVKGHAFLEGAVQRAVVAPFDGFIESSDKRAGDLVAAGEPLGSLDRAALDLELIELNGNRAQADSEYREARAAGDRAAMRVQQARIAQVDAQILIVEEKISRTRLVAPFDGYVSTGDLSRQLGSAVARGDVLFTVAPLNRYRVSIDVDERDIVWVSENDPVELVLSALPDESVSLAVDRVAPVAVVSQGRNIFRVEAALDDSDHRLRPGMDGVARIAVGRRKLGWIWTRRFVDWLRVSSWRWLP